MTHHTEFEGRQIAVTGRQVRPGRGRVTVEVLCGPPLDRAAYERLAALMRRLAAERGVTNLRERHS